MAEPQSSEILCRTHWCRTKGANSRLGNAPHRSGVLNAKPQLPARQHCALGVHQPGPRNLFIIAKALGVSVDDLRDMSEAAA